MSSDFSFYSAVESPTGLPQAGSGTPVPRWRLAREGPFLSELPHSVLHELEQLRGVPPNVQLSCEPWGHLNHADIDCVCLSSDRTGAYVHGLSLASSSPDFNIAPLLQPAAASASMFVMPEGPALEGPAQRLRVWEGTCLRKPGVLVLCPLYPIVLVRMAGCCWLRTCDGRLDC